MIYKILIQIWLSINFYTFVSYCQQISSESELSSNAFNISEWILRQWNQWPSGQWSETQWPQTQWNSSQWPSVSWNSSQWPSGQWKPETQRPQSTSTPWWPTKLPVIQRPSTFYPPINKPSPSLGVVSQRPSTPTPTPTQPTTVTTTTQKPTTVWQPPSRPSTQPPSTQTNGSFSITVKSCGLSHIPQVFIGNKIVSGKVAKGGEFPWQVILRIHTSRGPMQCGGAILNSRWVLTAAHCVSNERNGQPTAQRIDITAGVHNRLVMSAGSQMRSADCVIQHEGWTGQYGKFKHDIALIRLPESKPFDINYENGGHINGICLPINSMSEYYGKGRIAGWGLTKDRGSPSDILMYTDVSILSNDKCRTYPYPVPIADSMMCQGVDRTAPCQGDSGGPLIINIGDKRGVQRMTEVGIVSFGPGECANPKTPNAIYTKVSHYLKWIEKTIKANAGDRCSARQLKNDKTDETNTERHSISDY